MTKYDHIHKYELKKLGKYEVYKCMQPGCRHYIAKGLAENRLSICWKCSEAFVLMKEVMHMHKPKCQECRGKAKKVATVKQLDRLGELLNSDNLLEKIKDA